MPFSSFDFIQIFQNGGECLKDGRSRRRGLKEIEVSCLAGESVEVDQRCRCNSFYPTGCPYLLGGRRL